MIFELGRADWAVAKAGLFERRATPNRPQMVVLRFRFTFAVRKRSKTTPNSSQNRLDACQTGVFCNCRVCIPESPHFQDLKSLITQICAKNAMTDTSLKLSRNSPALAASCRGIVGSGRTSRATELCARAPDYSSRRVYRNNRRCDAMGEGRGGKSRRVNDPGEPGVSAPG